MGGGGALSPADVLAWVGRWVMVTGIVIALGAVSCRLLLGMVGQPWEPLPDRERRCASLGMWASLALLPAAAARLATHTMELADPGQTMSEWGDLLNAVMGHTHWGATLDIQVGIAIAASVAFALARGGSHRAWSAAGICAVGLAATPAFGGHAAAVEQYRVLVISADVLHVLAGGAWIGTLVVLATVTLRAEPRVSGRRRAPQEWGADIAGLVRAFSPVAMTSAGIMAVTGTIAAWAHLDTVSSLWRSGYGQVLLTKLSLVALVMAAGAYNWQRGTPGLTAPGGGGVRAFTRSVSIEIALGLLVLAATAVLVAMPFPMPMSMPMPMGK